MNFASSVSNIYGGKSEPEKFDSRVIRGSLNKFVESINEYSPEVSVNVVKKYQVFRWKHKETDDEGCSLFVHPIPLSTGTVN